MPRVVLYSSVNESWISCSVQVFNRALLVVILGAGDESSYNSVNERTKIEGRVMQDMGLGSKPSSAVVAEFKVSVPQICSAAAFASHDNHYITDYFTLLPRLDH